MSNYLTAVIPVRSGSQRVKNKSFRNFNKKNLLEYKIEKLKKIKLIDQIVVNTDSNVAISIAKKLNVSYWRREKYFASSSCSNSEFWQYVAKTTESKFIMFTNCTSPLLKIENYKKIIDKFEKVKKNNDSLNTVTEVKEFLCHKNKPINFSFNKAPNSQKLPDIVKLNFAVNILPRKTMIERKSVLGKKPFFYKIDEVEGFDIDSMLDFKFAENLHKELF
jgi:CMP-N-acetylneuraminic acid synthetase